MRDTGLGCSIHWCGECRAQLCCDGRNENDGATKLFGRGGSRKGKHMRNGKLGKPDWMGEIYLEILIVVGIGTIA